MAFCLALFCTAALAAGANVTEGVTSQVRADRGTGRLVRRVVVSSHEVIPRVVDPAAPGAPATAPATSASSTSGINSIVDEVASAHGVDPLLVHAIIRTESAYNAYAVSPKGAEGLMQLIPETARRYGVRNAFDKRQNVEGGVRYLKHLMSMFPDMRLVLAAYNAGENAVLSYRGIPPYDETQEYVYKVGKRYGELRRANRSAQQAAVKPPAEPEHRPLETFIDAEGRLHLRTR